MEPYDPYRPYSTPASSEPGQFFDSSRLSYADAYQRRPPRRRLGRWLGALALIVGLLGSTVTPSSILQAPSSLLSGPESLLTQLGGPFASLLPLGTDAAQAQSDTTEQALKDVVQKANDEQVQAIAGRDASVMADTSTADHYQELVQINQDLLNAGVTGIELLNLSWGPVSVDGNTGRVSTTETWRSTYANGSTDRSQDRNDYTLVLDNGSWKISADDHPSDLPAPGIGVAPQPPDRPAPPPGTRPGGPGTSRNWSGYAATGGTFTSVTGAWTVPDALSGQAAPGADATWVGIGGVRSQDLIQAGTQEAVSGNGRVHYEAWIEMLPRASRPVQLAVHPGDQVTVTISEQAADTWLIDFNNATTGETYQQSVSYSSSHSSAEWVEEAPSAGRRILPLSNFGTIQFSSGSAQRDGQTLSIADLKGRAITMIDRSGQPLATTSPLADDGGSFSISRTDVAAAAAPQASDGGGQAGAGGGQAGAGRRGGGGGGQNPGFTLFP